MVVSAQELASAAGMAVLAKGGNAVDAAVAVGFALAVVYPEAGNIGGGGYMTIVKRDGTREVIDFREKAPLRATREMYGDSVGDKSVNGPLAAGVPGTVAGLLLAHERHGRLKREMLLQPAIDLAEKGFRVSEEVAQSFAWYAEDLRQFPSTMEVFWKDTSFVEEGDTLRQPDLAATLRRIQRSGRDGFYRDTTARLVAEAMRQGGGIMTEEDLERYGAEPHDPLVGRYRGYEVVCPPPSSSGGMCLLELLNLAEGYDLTSMGFHSSRSVHALCESMKRVYADRATYMGDANFYDVPVDRLIDKQYAAQRRKEIDSSKAAPADVVHAGDISEGNHTTHYCVADAEGNVVATTYTINDLFGSKVVVKGAGFFLNDEMDDFSLRPGVPNMYGLVGGEANAIAPEKRPLSSMTPVVLLRDGKPVLVAGARGGGRIITAVFQTIVNIVDYGMDVQEAVDQPRFHHQWKPDVLKFERFALSDDVVRRLAAMGHVVEEDEESFGALQAIALDPEKGLLFGASDPREGGYPLGY